VIHDIGAGLFRWRQIMPRALGEAELGPENEEVTASRSILSRRRAEVDTRTAAPGGGLIFTGKADGTPVELLIDPDGRIKRARCLCSHFRKAGLRMGPCRHVLALRWMAFNPTPEPVTATDWFARLRAQAAPKGGAREQTF